MQSTNELKSKLLKTIIDLIRDQCQKADSVNKAIMMYTDFDGDWFTWYTKRQWAILDILLWEDFTSDIINYISEWKYYIIDWNRIEKEGKSWCRNDERDEYALKIITDDNTFIEYILDISSSI